MNSETKAAVQVLRNKNLATRFQILVEIAANQPFVQQKDIAHRIGVTSQAVSDYIARMEADGWIASDGRSRHRVTKEGVNWLLKALRELQAYSSAVERTLVNVTTWAAIAGEDLKQGQTVNLVMKRGLLYATAGGVKGAHGTATSDAREGEDVGVSDIEGIVPLRPGSVTVLEVPDIQNGGSARTDVTKMRRALAGADKVGAVGTEAVVALRRLQREPDYLYGVIQAAVEAARSGLEFAIVCTGSGSPALLQKLAEEGVSYRLIDARHTPPAGKRKGRP